MSDFSLSSFFSRGVFHAELNCIAQEVSRHAFGLVNCERDVYVCCLEGFTQRARSFICVAQGAHAKSAKWLRFAKGRNLLLW